MRSLAFVLGGRVWVELLVVRDGGVVEVREGGRCVRSLWGTESALTGQVVGNFVE